MQWFFDWFDLWFDLWFGKTAPAPGPETTDCQWPCCAPPPPPPCVACTQMVGDGDPYCNFHSNYGSWTHNDTSWTATTAGSITCEQEGQVIAFTINAAHNLDTAQILIGGLTVQVVISTSGSLSVNELSTPANLPVGVDHKIFIEYCDGVLYAWVQVSNGSWALVRHTGASDSSIILTALPASGSSLTFKEFSLSEKHVDDPQCPCDPEYPPLPPIPPPSGGCIRCLDVNNTPPYFLATLSGVTNKPGSCQECSRFNIPYILQYEGSNLPQFSGCCTWGTTGDRAGQDVCESNVFNKGSFPTMVLGICNQNTQARGNEPVTGFYANVGTTKGGGLTPYFLNRAIPLSCYGGGTLAYHSGTSGGDYAGCTFGPGTAITVAPLF